MVANIRSRPSPSGALYYNKEKVDKDEAEVLFWQKMLEPFDKHGRMDVDACMDCFWPYLEANRRTTNTVFHASLNPSPEDRLTDKQLREIAQEYMERMGYGNQPYIVFKHKDISREHLHIVSLRVDENGHKLPHDFEARRSMEILRDLEQGPLGDAQGLADLLGRKPPDSCRLGGEGMERRHSLQKTLKVRLHLFIGARFHKDAIHNAEGLGDFCVKDVQDNPSLQKTIPMSAPDRSSPLKGKNDPR